ncbi:MAG: CinA family nicotinamide mononucleotide deamidase-related protein [Candidatus Dadabacteria bacterium]|nr:MAG: CinA family nicotinamide mononucleotide deamidase-related protein [Candidatus Dadabacteria bacterium]
MKQSVALLIIGSELLDGRVADTNSALICELCADAGIPVNSIVTVADSEQSIISALEFLSARAGYIIISGGIGPTTDDLTREAVAAFSGRELIPDKESHRALIKRYKKSGRKLDPAGEKQALFPEGSVIIPNTTGTAPGFRLSGAFAGKESVTIFALPGVPSELKLMLNESVLPYIREQEKQIKPALTKTLKFFGIPESLLCSKITDANLPDHIMLSYRANFPVIELKVSTFAGTEELNGALNQIRKSVGEEFIFSEAPELSLPAVVCSLLKDKGYTLATAESCTGGLIGKLITDIPGSSGCFKGSLVTYSNEAKLKLLSVNEEVLKDKGAVSAEVAEQMAGGAQKAFNSDLSLSVTGIAGPSGGSEEKPVGTFYIGFVATDCSAVFNYKFPSERKRVRAFAAYAALDVVRRYLLKLDFDHKPL